MACCAHVEPDKSVKYTKRTGVADCGAEVVAEKYGERPKEFKKLVGYIWDYYKIHIIAALCVALLVFITIYNLAARTNPDYVVVIAFSRSVADEQLEPLRLFIQEHGEDRNGDGEVLVEIVNISYNMFVAPGEGVAVDRQLMQAARTRLGAELRQNSAMIFITDDPYFEDLQRQFDGNLFADVSHFNRWNLPTTTVPPAPYNLRMSSVDIPNFQHFGVPEFINFSIRQGDSERWQNSYDLLTRIFYIETERADD